MTTLDEAPASPGRARDAGWYTPPGLPPEFRAFDTPVSNLGVGTAGKVGLLDLDLAPIAGKTRIVRHYQQMPLYLFHPIYIDPGRPDMAFLYLLQGGDGPLQGDRYRLDIACAPGAAVHVTTQAATKIYGMRENFATQIINLSVGAGGFVEYLPDPVIPFRGARFYQRFALTIDSTATAILGETLLPGRVARGEAHVYATYYTDLEVGACDGTLLFADRVRFRPASATPRSPARLGPYDVLGTLYVLSRQEAPPRLVAALRDALAGQDAVLAGVSELPNDSGAAMRLLGATSSDVRKAVHLAWNAARLLLVGVPAPDLRKGS